MPSTRTRHHQTLRAHNSLPGFSDESRKPTRQCPTTASEIGRNDFRELFPRLCGASFHVDVVISLAGEINRRVFMTDPAFGLTKRIDGLSRVKPADGVGRFEPDAPELFTLLGDRRSAGPRALRTRRRVHANRSCRSVRSYHFIRIRAPRRAATAVKNGVFSTTMKSISGFLPANVT